MAVCFIVSWYRFAIASNNGPLITWSPFRKRFSHYSPKSTQFALIWISKKWTWIKEKQNLYLIWIVSEKSFANGPYINIEIDIDWIWYLIQFTLSPFLSINQRYHRHPGSVRDSGTNGLYLAWAVCLHIYVCECVSLQSHFCRIHFYFQHKLLPTSMLYGTYDICALSSAWPLLTSINMLSLLRSGIIHHNSFVKAIWGRISLWWSMDICIFSVFENGLV